MKRIRLEERIEIYHLLKLNYSLRKIAKKLKRSVSSISYEVKKGGSIEQYNPILSDKRSKRKAKSRRFAKRKIDKNERLKNFIIYHLKEKQWSPEQIAKVWNRDYAKVEGGMTISHETIYAYIYVLPRGSLKRELIKALRQERAYRRKQKRGGKAQRSIENMLSIHERPKEVEDRTIPGHWEGDLIVGKRNQSALGTLVERTTRTVLLVPLKSRDAKHVAEQFAKVIKKLPKEMKLTMTYDQGREMAKHSIITKMTGVKVYFADPRSPWQRGTNENTNGLIRQYFPKGTDFNKVPLKEIKRVQDLLNGRPRKVLNWFTPYEVFDRLVGKCSVKK